MPIRFSCPKCSKTFNAPDTAAGKQVQCPSCSTPLLVPGGVAAEQAPPPLEYADEAPAPQIHYHVGGPSAPPSAGMAIAGMVLGIVGFIFAFVPCVGWIGILLGILGAVFSSIGLAHALKVRVGKGMAITGLSLSILAILWWPIWTAICLAMFAHAVNDAIKNAPNNPTFNPPVNSSNQ
jgi:DNA-directed RNA polymerase subunit RPC12/RpoP